MNMLDLLREAQGGSGIDNLARRFDLDRAQTEQVLEHVLPAMSAGFKHKAQDPDGLQTLLQQLQGQDYEDVYQDPDAIRRDDVRDRGNQVLGEIFGSKDVSRDVAQRTELFSGVGSGVIKAMLPVIASMVLGGMQRRTSTDSGMGGVLGTLIKGAMGGGGRRSSGGGLEDLIGAVLGGGGQAQPQRRSGGGLGGLLGALLGGGRGGRSARAPAPRQGQGGGLEDMLGGLLGANPRQRRSTGDRNLDNVLGMFDADGDGRVDMDVLQKLGRRR